MAGKLRRRARGHWRTTSRDRGDRNGRLARLGVEPLETRRLLDGESVQFHVTVIEDELDGDTSAADLSLREAVSLANAADGDATIHVPAGTYRLTRAGAGEESNATGDLNYFGAGRLHIIGDGPAQTIVDGMNLDRVFSVGNTTLEGLTIQHGRTQNVSPGFQGEYGGGILAFAATELINVHLIDNQASYGGGIYASPEYANLRIIDSRIANNTALLAGGAVHLGEDCSLTMINSILEGNVADDGGAIFGYDHSGPVEIVDSVLRGNRATAAGGAIYGGSITTLAIDRTTIADNQAATGGAIYFEVDGPGDDCLLTNSTLSGNSAANGGGIYVDTGIVVVRGSTISGNSAGFAGGGFYNASGELEIAHSTIADNRARQAILGPIVEAAGGGVFADAGTTSLTHTIVADNFSNAGGPGIVDDDLAGDFTNSTFNLIGSPEGFTGIGGSGNQINVEARLSPLGIYGGPTQTHLLLFGSPAIDRGNPSLVLPVDATDQRGLPRLFDGDDNGSVRIDIGAVEMQPITLIVTTTDDELDVEFNPDDLSLREAIDLANRLTLETTIIVPAGLYRLTGHLINHRPVNIVGAGPTETILDAQRMGSVYVADSPLEMSGMTLTGGLSDDGGGIAFPEDSSARLSNMIITDNISTDLGGGILIGEDCDVELRNVVISHNSATLGGGIAYLNYPNRMIIEDSRIEDNTAAGGGGAYIVTAGVVEIRNSSFLRNSAEDSGGAMLLLVDALLSNVVVEGNLAENGGGLYTSGVVTIQRSTIANNQARNSGGGVFNVAMNRTLTIRDSTLNGNLADNDGGGVCTADGNVSVVNSTVSGNQAQRGGGIARLAGSLRVLHSTIAENEVSATGGGGGIFGDALLDHTIVTGNARSLGGGGLARDNLMGNYSESRFNLIESSSGFTGINGNGNLVLPFPQIMPLGDYGGPTLTHALIDPRAIDAGDPNFNPTTLAPSLVSDQRGFLRIDDGNDDGIAVVDIGAFEVHRRPLVVTTTDDELDDQFDPDDLSLREAISVANGIPDNFRIYVPAGTYRLTRTGAGEFANATGDLNYFGLGRLHIVGDGPGQTIIDGMELDRVFSVRNIKFEALTVQNGNALGGVAGQSGGGILASDFLELIDVHVINNSAGYGGGVYISPEDTTLRIRGSRIADNTATVEGGAVHFAEDCMVSIVESTIEGNEAGGDGGAIFGYDHVDLLEVIDSVLVHNRASRHGGAIYIGSGSPIIILRSTLAENEAGGYGGAALLNADDGDEFTMRDSTISGNRAAQGGGGLFVDGFMHIVNSTVSGNESPVGAGGIESPEGHLFIDNSTIEENLGGGETGGILVNSDFAQATLHNTIVAGNRPLFLDVVVPDVIGVFDPASSFNVIGIADGAFTNGQNGNQVGTIAAPLDARLGPLADNGGPTQTHLPLPGSPAINAGDPDFDPEGFDPPLLTDQRGEPRIVGIPRRVDIGAVEEQSIPVAVVAARHVFYNQSAWDGNSAAIGVADNAAIAPDKTPLLPGGTGTFANYTSYDKGINGIIIDLAGPHGAISPADFAFKTGNVNNTASWTPLATAPTVDVRVGGGVGGSDRITLTFPTNTIRKTWVQVRMLANGNTNLVVPDVFYFGNAVGDVGDTTSNALVHGTDEIQIRANPRNILNPAPVNFRFDIDRNKLVNATDQIIVRSNVTNVVTALRLIVPLASPGGVPPAAGALANAAHVEAAGNEVDVIARRRRR